MARTSNAQAGSSWLARLSATPDLIDDDSGDERLTKPNAAAAVDEDGLNEWTVHTYKPVTKQKGTNDDTVVSLQTCSPRNRSTLSSWATS
jgi:hypothetical protein